MHDPGAMTQLRATSLAITLAGGLAAGLAPAGCSGSDPGEGDPAGGPDAGPEAPDGGPAAAGRFIIYASGVEPCEWVQGQEVCPKDHNRELFRVDLDAEGRATGEVRLTDNSDGLAPQPGMASPDDDAFLALHPSGAWLLAANSVAGNRDIYRVAADGAGEPERLTSTGAADYFLALSRDGETVWYVSDQDGAFDLWRMDAATGEGAVNLTGGAVDLSGVLALLPDESGFLLSIGSGHDPDGDGGDAELYLLPLADPTPVPLTDDRVNSRFAGLSRDGTQVFFTRYDDANDDGVTDGGVNLWGVPSDGSAPARRLTSYTTPSLELMAITPDGDRAIYEYRTAKKEIYSVATAGGEPVQLSASPGGESSYFRLLSADGGTVVYTSNDRPGGFGDTEIYRVPTAGGDSVLMTAFDNESYFLPAAHLPDHGSLLYDSPLDGDTDYYVVPMAGGEHVNLTRNDGWGDSAQGLSPDGAYLLFSNLSDDPIYDEDGVLTPENDQDIYLTRTDGTGPIHQLTDNRVYDRLEAVFLAGAADPRAARDRAVSRPAASGPAALWRHPRLAAGSPSAAPIDDRTPAPVRR